MLIDWLGSVADDAGDAVVATMRSLGFDEYPETEELRPARSVLLMFWRIDPTWDDRRFLSDFYNDILHPDTCGPYTADGVPLSAAIAGDDRVPARHRFDAVDLLFDIATNAVADVAQPISAPISAPRYVSGA